MQHSVKTNYMYVQQLIFFSCFVNIHITDICTIDLQKKKKKQQKTSYLENCLRSYPYKRDILLAADHPPFSPVQ